MSRKNPYVGPRSFQRTDEDKLNFYGRPREVERLLNLLIAERIVLLHSPSGAGKTSLINAGLIPELEEEEFFVLPVMRVNRFLPTDKLGGITALNRYVFSALLYLEGYEESKSQAQTSVDRLKELAGMSFVHYLRKRSLLKDEKNQADENVGSSPESTESQKPSPESKQIVLIFDQFEEILTANSTDFTEKLDFCKQVGAALRDDNCWALFSMREDYVASLGSLLRPLPTRLSNRFKLELLTKKWAREAIEKPAEKDVSFEKEAVEKLINELATVNVPNYDGTGTTKDVVGEYVEPMQLQVVCLRLWDNLSFPADITQKIEFKYTDLKSTHVDSSLTAFYEDCLDQVTQIQTERDEAEIRLWIQDKLITSAGTRGLVFMGDDLAEGMTRQVVDELVKRHLLRGEQRGGSRWIELTHDRFIKPIVESNRPWLSLQGLEYKARRARALALSGFLILILFWVFLEWFMVKPFRESQRYWMELDAIHAVQNQANVMKTRVRDAIQAVQNTDKTRLDTLISNTKSESEVALRRVEAQRHGKRNAKLLVRNSNKFEKLSTDAFSYCQANNCSVLSNALEHLEKDSENNWKSFTLSDADVKALLSAVKDIASSIQYLEQVDYTDRNPASSNIVSRTIAVLGPNPRLQQSISSYSLRPVQDFVRKTADPKKNQQFREMLAEVRQKLTQAEMKIGQAQKQKNWTDLRFEEELRVVEEAVRFNLGISLDHLRKYEEKSARRSDWLNQKEKQITTADWKYKGVLPPLYTVRPKQTTTLLYGLWCLLLVFYIFYLANAMRAAEQVVSSLDLTHTKVDIADAMGWRLTKLFPPVITVVAICCLMLIHFRPTWLAYEVLKTSSSARWTLVILMAAPVLTAIYYVTRRFTFARFLSRKKGLSIQSPAVTDSNVLIKT